MAAEAEAAVVNHKRLNLPRRLQSGQMVMVLALDVEEEIAGSVWEFWGTSPVQNLGKNLYPGWVYVE